MLQIIWLDDIKNLRQCFAPRCRNLFTVALSIQGIKCFQHRLEDDKIAYMGKYIILFTVSSFELPTTFLKKVVFRLFKCLIPFRV